MPRHSRRDRQPLDGPPVDHRHDIGHRVDHARPGRPDRNLSKLRESRCEGRPDPRHAAPVRRGIQDPLPLERRRPVAPAPRRAPPVGIALRRRRQEPVPERVALQLGEKLAEPPERVRPEVELVEVGGRQRVAPVLPPPEREPPVRRVAREDLRQWPRCRHRRLHRKLRDLDPVVAQEKRRPRPARHDDLRAGNAPRFRHHARHAPRLEVERAHRAALDDHRPPRLGHPRERGHRRPGFGPGIRRRPEPADPPRRLPRHQLRHLGPRQHPRVEPMRPRVRHPPLEPRKLGLGPREIENPGPPQAHRLSGFRGQRLPMPLRLAHDRDLGRIPPLAADPPPVPRGLLPRDPPLLEHDRAQPPLGKKERRRHPDHPAADHRHVAGGGRRPREGHGRGLGYRKRHRHDAPPHFIRRPVTPRSRPIRSRRCCPQRPPERKALRRGE